jgi:hypothetical protein
MKRNLLTMALLATLLIGTFASLPAVFSGNPGPAPNGVSMWLQPDTISYTTASPPPGYKFKVYVKCEIGSGVSTYAWQFFITYNSAHLNALNGGYLGAGNVENPAGSGKSEWANGYSTSPLSPAFGVGYVVLGESLSGAVSQSTPGVYNLAWVEFQIVGFPVKYETLTSSIRLDVVGDYNSYMLDPDLNELPINFGNAAYSFQWTAPPKPDVTVDPVSTVFSEEPPSSVGKTFPIRVLIKNLDPAWGLHNASFDLSFDNSLIGIIDYAVDPMWGTCVFNNSTGTVHVEVKDPTGTPGGDVNTVTITFAVLYQGVYPAVDVSPLDLKNVVLFDTLAEIEVKSVTDGSVTIKGLRTLELPYLTVSSVTMGPEPVLGQEFNVTVSITGLERGWYFIGLDFRLRYDPELIEPVAVLEGPFLPYWSSLQPGSLGTFWYGQNKSDGGYGPHILVGNMIYPNGSGWWNPPWPEGTGVVAIITFKVKYQPYSLGSNSSLLNIITQSWVGLDGPETQEIVDIPYADPVNGVYTIRWNMFTGRVIDVYGGAVNRGYGTAHGTKYNGIGVIWPAPYGGQGPQGNMDLVIPQSVVYLFALVTYNHWPVQSKDVAFVVEGPNGFVRIYSNRTDENGVAWIMFQMPWPCDNPEDYFGKWTVTVSVDICGEVATDSLMFDYYYLVEITKVTTDKYEYKHGENVEVTIEYRSKAQQSYPVMFSIVLQDDLETTVAGITVTKEVGGAKFCHWKEFNTTVCVEIPKWAFAGIAKIYVSAFDKDPRSGGAAWCPTYGLGWPLGATVPKILINAYE